MVEYCDLVMKGGITSGVIYPKLIARLASKYQFKNIGGTSAGAIAASACAAAQYGVHHGNPQAFDTLTKLPELLSEKITADRRSKLFTLFQPAASVRRHFAVLVGMLNKDPREAVQAVLGGLIHMYKTSVVIGILLGSPLLYPFIDALLPIVDEWKRVAASLGLMLLITGMTALSVRSFVRGKTVRALLWAAALPLLVFTALALATAHGSAFRLGAYTVGTIAVTLLYQAAVCAAIVGFFARSLLRGLHGNHYGLCSGRTPDDAASTNHQEGLTNWLTNYLNALAGLSPDAPPLTFGQLWGHADPTQPRAINLEVMTTAISQQMVYSIPFRDGTPSFYYDPEEWSLLFPKSVMDALNQAHSHSSENEEDSQAKSLEVQSASGTTLRPLPRSAGLPVVVAIRMSLSFPLLLSAVPLHAIDWSLKDNAQRKREGRPLLAKRVWFSDGGIGSNMPLHMFDSLLPGHPTFAVNLKAEHPDHQISTPETADNAGGRVYLPEDRRGGMQRYWQPADDTAPLSGLIGFFSSIVNTMQSWRDEIMFPYPGFRERIVQISQREGEGGLNLDMPSDTIEALGNAGAMAADRLIDSFHPSGAQQAEGWRRHQEARLTTLLGTLQPASEAIGPALQSGVWHTVVDTIASYKADERQLAEDYLNELQVLGALGAGHKPSMQDVAPKPLAQLKISPRI
ncbi:patatin-like phospholipase family protein [Acidovorax sp. SUPP3334]|uniref:patatin-like phospholipase family protein n=1 Tax=Acidovorax sp. SUPP3334 TaxID=2920881 RepID=UPI0023DE217D|nr:patatin-like phospholipase family protein [Acidovorax sp. SUPP3334]GKT24383.1 hypothetical protein AVHM3334_14630 [Acidovorax sp. SUPP3334]